MQDIECASWAEFRASMSRYCGLKDTRRNEFWFRGQGDRQLPLQTTLDRHFNIPDDIRRQQMFKMLLDEFQREAVRLQYDERFTSDIDKLELLARHHGLPSPLLDWTQSPFVAAYFAFSDLQQGATFVSVWMVDLAQLDPTELDFELINDLAKIEGNPRALKQNGVFMRITTVRKNVESLLGNGLYRFNIPASERGIALAELDEMMVNGTYLYYDLNGAAQTALHRVGASHDSG